MDTIPHGNLGVIRATDKADYFIFDLLEFDRALVYDFDPTQDFIVIENFTASVGEPYAYNGGFGIDQDGGHLHVYNWDVGKTFVDAAAVGGWELGYVQPRLMNVQVDPTSFYQNNTIITSGEFMA